MSEAKAKYLAAKAAFEETFEKHLQNGVEFISDQVFIDPEVEIAPGAVILPGCILRGKTVIGANCVIGPNTLIEDSTVDEGTTVNAKDKKAYSALQNMQSSMVAGNAANVPGNGVSIPKQLVAGGVMELNLVGGLKDTKGQAINSDWMPKDVHPLITGEDLLDTDGKTLKGDTLGNTANPDKIANPDNLKFSEKMRTLFIGEDSSQHVNNFLWAYNVDTKQLSRLLSVPAGGESTGLHAIDEINGWTYIMSNFQHAGDWSSLHAKIKDTLDPLINANYRNKFGAAVGYITGAPKQIKLKA